MPEFEKYYRPRTFNPWSTYQTGFIPLDLKNEQLKKEDENLDTLLIVKADKEQKFNLNISL